MGEKMSGFDGTDGTDGPEPMARTEPPLARVVGAGSPAGRSASRQRLLGCRGFLRAPPDLGRRTLAAASAGRSCLGRRPSSHHLWKSRCTAAVPLRRVVAEIFCTTGAGGVRRDNACRRGCAGPKSMASGGRGGPAPAQVDDAARPRTSIGRPLHQCCHRPGVPDRRGRARGVRGFGGISTGPHGGNYGAADRHHCILARGIELQPIVTSCDYLSLRRSAVCRQFPRHALQAPV